MCWGLWVYVRQSDVLGFVGVRPSVSLMCWGLWVYVRQSDVLGFVGVRPSV